MDGFEQAAIEQLRALLECDEDPFARTTSPRHVTASGIVLDRRTGTILLHLHRRLGRWLQPGGHVEAGEAPSVTAIRETHEETGILVRHPLTGPRILHIDEHPGPDGHLHIDLRYLLLADRRSPRIGPGEVTGTGPGATLRWVEPATIAHITDGSLERAVRRLPDDV